MSLLDVISFPNWLLNAITECEPLRKDDYPPAIADMLGVSLAAGETWMSKEVAVLVSWLEAVGEVFGVLYARNKVSTMRALVESLGGTWDDGTMSSVGTKSGGGSNIKEAAFRELYERLRLIVCPA